PERDGEAVLDQATARAGAWRLGDTLGIVGADGAPHRFRVGGVTGFAGAQSPASELDTLDTPTVAVLQIAAAQRLLGRGGTVDEVRVRAAPGVGADVLRDRIAGLLPAGRLEAVTAASLAARQAGEIQGYLDGLRAPLLAFAAVGALGPRQAPPPGKPARSKATSTGSAPPCWPSRRWRCWSAPSPSGTPSRCWSPAAPARGRWRGCSARPAGRCSARCC